MSHSPNAMEFSAPHIEKLGKRLEHAEACKGLWQACMELALRDLSFLKGVKAGEIELSKSRRSKFNEILEHDPREFIEDDWFEEICYMLQLNPALVRERFLT